MEQSYDWYRTLAQRAQGKEHEESKIKDPLHDYPRQLSHHQRVYEFYTTQFPDIDFIKFHVPRFATKEMGIQYFELMQDQFDTHCLSYLGNFSEDQFVIDCQNKINAAKLYEDIKWVLTKEKISVFRTYG